jgi:molybdenum cofactor cytidylyltransferase
MRGANKLLALLEGQPIVTHVVDEVLAAGVTPVVVVTGHDGQRVADALAGRPITLLENPRWTEGMSTSIASGVSALDGRVECALICLGDMPRVRVSDLRALLEASRRAALESPRAGSPAPAAWVPVHAGRRGNPVLWSASWFSKLTALRGDRGARGLLSRLGEQVVEVPAGAGVLFDVDTPDALDGARHGER